MDSAKDSAKQATITKLIQILTDLTTVREGDSYSQIAERLLSVNGKEVSANTLVEVSVMLKNETSDNTLEKGQVLLQEALAVRKKSKILKRELDHCASTILKLERQRITSGWKPLQVSPLQVASHK